MSVLIRKCSSSLLREKKVKNKVSCSTKRDEERTGVNYLSKNVVALRSDDFYFCLNVFLDSKHGMPSEFGEESYSEYLTTKSISTCDP
jgi:hypothetical protein